MSQNLTAGQKVRIDTTTGGCYDGKTGVILSKLVYPGDVPDDQVKPGIELSTGFAGWYKVRFDTPANNGGVQVLQDIFMPSELHAIA